MITVFKTSFNLCIVFILGSISICAAYNQLSGNYHYFGYFFDSLNLKTSKT
jgi:hypothetical protein